MKKCDLCPRMCGANRDLSPGYCGGGAKVKVARAALHHWEEPCISGTLGSGTVFFSGCPLQCCFCQNYKISAENFGKEISVSHLCTIFQNLERLGAHNINLVSPTHYVPQILQALEKAHLHIPIVYNSGGYERVETIALLQGKIDIYLPDLKYYDSGRSARYSNAKDYFQVASRAIQAMVRQVGPLQFGSDGLLKRGVIVRHMVMPGGYEDSLRLLDWLETTFRKEDILLSIMSQFTPFYRCHDYPEINRRITTYEYEKVLQRARKLPFEGFAQERSSAKEEYTPDFDLTGV